MAQTARTADGRTLCFADWGPAGGYPVLLMHGSPGCRLSVKSPELAASLGGRLITYDRPGYGRSDRKRGRAAVDCASDVAVIADALGLEEFAVVGHSAGSPHALAVGARLADRVSRVACYGAFAPLEELGLEEWSKDHDQESREYVATLLEGEERTAALLAEEDAKLRAGASAGDPAGAVVFEQTREGVWGWVDDELACISPWGFDVREIAAPTVIWSNPNDTVSPPNHAEWLVRAIPKASLVSSPNAPGHVAVVDPDAARTELYSWLIGAV